MSDYLKKLQESNRAIYGFIRSVKSEGPTSLIENGEESDEEEHECKEGYKWCPKKEACVPMEDMGKDKK